MNTVYIQRKDLSTGQLETVDQCDDMTRSERRELLANYRESDYAGFYYTSQRACKDWS